MGRQLNERIQRLLNLKGAEAYEILGKKLKNSPKTVRRWIKDGPPNSNAAFRLAKALGSEEEEAHAIARECFPEISRAS